MNELKKFLEIILKSNMIRFCNRIDKLSIHDEKSFKKSIKSILSVTKCKHAVDGIWACMATYPGPISSMSNVCISIQCLVSTMEFMIDSYFFLSQSHEKLKEKIQMKKTKKYWLSISDDHANTINKCMQFNWLQALLFNRLMFGFNEGYKSCNELASRILNQCRLPECILNNRISFAPGPARLSSFKCEFCIGFFLNALLYFVN